MVHTQCTSIWHLFAGIIHCASSSLSLHNVYYPTCAAKQQIRSKNLDIQSCLILANLSIESVLIKQVTQNIFLHVCWYYKVHHWLNITCKSCDGDIILNCMHKIHNVYDTMSQFYPPVCVLCVYSFDIISTATTIKCTDSMFDLAGIAGARIVIEEQLVW